MHGNRYWFFYSRFRHNRSVLCQIFRKMTWLLHELYAFYFILLVKFVYSLNCKSITVNTNHDYTSSFCVLFYVCVVIQPCVQVWCHNLPYMHCNFRFLKGIQIDGKFWNPNVQNHAVAQENAWRPHFFFTFSTPIYYNLSKKTHFTKFSWLWFQTRLQP